MTPGFSAPIGLTSSMNRPCWQSAVERSGWERRAARSGRAGDRPDWKKEPRAQQDGKEGSPITRPDNALSPLSIPDRTRPKVSIIPRGISALGYTLQLRERTGSSWRNRIGKQDRRTAWRQDSRRIDLRGSLHRAQNYLLKATDIAKSMVKAMG